MIAVLGAGLAGSCVALELARKGLDVTLIEQDARPVNRASLRNEGKVHLGLVYALSGSPTTARLMHAGALHFMPVLRRLLGASADQLPLSTPFRYLVAPDSLAGLAELASHYEELGAWHRARLREEPGLDYLGRRPQRLHRALDPDELGRWFRPESLIGGFETPELAVDTDALAGRIRAAVRASPRITFLPGRRVVGITRDADAFRIEGEGAPGAWSERARQVVNATWHDRARLDRTVGREATPGLLHRLKYRVIVRLPAALRDAPSVTMVLGRYGDVVVRPDGTAYLSWYPAALKGWCTEIAPPPSWEGPCRGEVDPAAARALAAEVLGAIDAWFPGMAGAEPLLVDAGVITAYGRSDVDDQSSGLHDRSRIGVTSEHGYHSLDTGKLTTAPLFARRCAERVIAHEVELAS